MTYLFREKYIKKIRSGWLATPPAAAWLPNQNIDPINNQVNSGVESGCGPVFIYYYFFFFRSSFCGGLTRRFCSLTHCQEAGAGCADRGVLRRVEEYVVGHHRGVVRGSPVSVESPATQGSVGGVVAHGHGTLEEDLLFHGPAVVLVVVAVVVMLLQRTTPKRAVGRR